MPRRVGLRPRGGSRPTRRTCNALLASLVDLTDPTNATRKASWARDLEPVGEYLDPNMVARVAVGAVDHGVDQSRSRVRVGDEPRTTACLRHSAVYRSEAYSGEVAEGQLADHPCVSEDEPGVQQAREHGVSGPEVIDPDRRVGQDHDIGLWRRGMS